MAIEINNNTVIRLIVRRGTYSDLSYATLAQGELGYTVDTNRLVVGKNNQIGLSGVTVAGNKFLGQIAKESVSSPFYGDYVKDTTTGRLHVYDNVDGSGWVDVSTDLPTAGTGLKANGTLISFDPWYATWSDYSSLTGGTGQLFVGTASATPGYSYTDSRLITQGPISVFGSPSTTNRILLKAAANTSSINLEGTKSTINVGTSGIVVGTDAVYLSTFNNKTFTIRNGLATGTLQELSANPSFVFDGGGVRINSSLYCTGSAFFENITNNTVTTISGTSAFVVDVTDVTTTPMTGFRLIDNNAVAGQWLVTAESNGRALFGAKGDSGGFVGVNDLTSYSNSNFTVSGHQYYHGGSFTVKSTNLSLSSNATISLLNNVNVTGDLSATGDIIGFSTSDERLKTNIKPIDNALSKLLALRGVEFDWSTSDTTRYTGHDVGLIAQDVIKQVPEAVGTRHDGYYGVHYEKIIPLLVEAIRELNNKPR